MMLVYTDEYRDFDGITRILRLAVRMGRPAAAPARRRSRRRSCRCPAAAVRGDVPGGDGDDAARRSRPALRRTAAPRGPLGSFGVHHRVGHLVHPGPELPDTGPARVGRAGVGCGPWPVTSCLRWPGCCRWRSPAPTSPPTGRAAGPALPGRPPWISGWRSMRPRCAMPPPTACCWLPHPGRRDPGVAGRGPALAAGAYGGRRLHHHRLTTRPDIALRIDGHVGACGVAAGGGHRPGRAPYRPRLHR